LLKTLSSNSSENVLLETWVEPEMGTFSFALPAGAPTLETDVKFGGEARGWVTLVNPALLKQLAHNDLSECTQAPHPIM
ncbi:MAG: hypothetical protein VKJ46_04800, partial [Leptolyngbyaceae bacterium]|nr:hypothetical protein [Leptolyngbyaceae bacterium]